MGNAVKGRHAGSGTPQRGGQSLYRGDAGSQSSETARPTSDRKEGNVRDRRSRSCQHSVNVTQQSGGVFSFIHTHLFGELLASATERDASHFRSGVETEDQHIWGGKHDLD